MNLLAIDAMLAGLVGLLGAGARFILCDGIQPPPGGALTRVIAQAVLSAPAGAILKGTLTLAQADQAGDMALATGIPTWGRLALADGTWIEDFTVSGISGNGQVRVVVQNPPEGDPEAKLYQGGTFFLGAVVIGG